MKTTDRPIVLGLPHWIPPTIECTHPQDLIDGLSPSNVSIKKEYWEEASYKPEIFLMNAVEKKEIVDGKERYVLKAKYFNLSNLEYNRFSEMDRSMKLMPRIRFI